MVTAAIVVVMTPARDRRRAHVDISVSAIDRDAAAQRVAAMSIGVRP